MAESSSSLSASGETDTTQQLGNGKQQLYVVLVRGGKRYSPSVVPFDDINEGLRFYYKHLEMQRQGKFLGQVLAFLGQQLECSEPVSSYKVKLGDLTLVLGRK